MQNFSRHIYSNPHQSAYSRLTGADLADYILDCARRDGPSVTPPGSGLSGTPSDTTIFTCKAHLFFFDTMRQCKRELCSGNLSLVFSSPAGGHLLTEQGSYWDPASLTVSLSMDPKAGNGYCYNMKFFKGIQFQRVQQGENPDKRWLKFMPVEFGEPLELFIHTDTAQDATELHDHIKVIVSRCFA